MHVRLHILYIVLTISFLIGQEPLAYFENSRDFVDKHDYSVICYPCNYVCRLYCMQCACVNTPLAKEQEHLNGFKIE